jgi:hypothetical protein
VLGREYETTLLRGLVEHIRDRGGAVVVRGEAGIGKSALLVEASRIAAAGGLRVLSTAGVQSEAQVAFSGLHQLLGPVMRQVDELPGPQRGALLAAFGRTEAVAPDLFLIALADAESVGRDRGPSTDSAGGGACTLARPRQCGLRRPTQTDRGQPQLPGREAVPRRAVAIAVRAPGIGPAGHGGRRYLVEVPPWRVVEPRRW